MRRLAAALLLIGGGAAAQDAPLADPPLAAQAPDAVAERFAAMDADGNGRVDAAEWDRAVSAHLAAASAGGSARPSSGASLPLPVAERAALMRALFPRLDTDRDGALTLDEVRAFGRALGASARR